MEYVAYREGLFKQSILNCRVHKDMVTIFSDRKVHGFANYINALGKKEDNVYVKTLNIEDHLIEDIYKVRLYLYLDGKKMQTAIKNDKLQLVVEVRGSDKEELSDFMKQAGFKADAVQWDQYGLHYNFYHYDFDALKEVFADAKLTMEKRDLRTKLVTEKTVSFEEAKNVAMQLLK